MSLQSQTYFAASLQPFIGQMVAVQMTSNHVKQGLLKLVTADYVLLDVCRVPFHIRLGEVQWVTPLHTK